MFLSSRIRKQLVAIVFKRWYSQITNAGTRASNHINGSSKVGVLVGSNVFNVEKRREVYHYGFVRFYAAPVQVKTKVEDEMNKDMRLNEAIKASTVRLILEEGHEIVPISIALNRAKELGLDLVEVQGKADPPVCKILDFNKEKYKKLLWKKELKKKKGALALKHGSCKTIKIAQNCGQHDLQMKANGVKRVMEKGYRVKCEVTGNEDQNLEATLSRLITLIEDVCVIESGPRMEKNQAYVVVRHIRYGPPKKKPVKSNLTVGEPETTESSLGMEAQESTDSGSESDDLVEIVPTSAFKETKHAWSALDANNGLENVYVNNGKLNPSGPTIADLAMPSSTSGPSPREQNRYGKKSQQESKQPPTRLPNRIHNDFTPVSEQRSRFPSTNSIERTPVTCTEQRSRFPPTNMPERTLKPSTDQRSRFPPATLLERTPNNVKPPSNIRSAPTTRNPENAVYKPRPVPSNIQNTPSSTETNRIVTDGKQSPPSIPTSPRSSYGIFSARVDPKTTSSSPSVDPLTSKAEDKQNPEASGQGKWGIFSRPQ